MFVIIGIVVVLGSMLGGFMMAGGNPLTLLQVSEFVTIGGVILGSILIANPLPTVIKIVKDMLGTLKGPSVNKAAYLDLLKLLYEVFQFSKREGLIALESHVENPTSSSIFSKYPSFLANHHAVDFLCDTLKVLLSGGVPAHDLDELMDTDLERIHEEEHVPSAQMQVVADAFPGIGIVAAVLGIIVTMGSIDQGAAAVGHHVGAALVGTFLGVLMSYGIVGPIASLMGTYANIEGKYIMVIKAAVLSYAKGAPSNVAVEFGRRSIDPANRPTFKETEEHYRK
ncbi:MAG: flagellar motor stator protein MotA [Ignavibacteria bacterium]|jgi:chemotaxis protein MotA|nr:flagellar motor stator protein MotA [Ignavibacteria bacterium]